MANKINVIINGEIETIVVKEFLITFFNLSTRVIKSHLPLTELYLKYETAMTIEEI